MGGWMEGMSVAMVCIGVLVSAGREGDGERERERESIPYELRLASFVWIELMTLDGDVQEI